MKLAAIDCILTPLYGYRIVQLPVLLVSMHILVGPTPLTFDISRVFPGYIFSVFERTRR